ncbi:hypothetical protein L1987_66596 [Smallanthus sonchifolius]|uniref:Uncharacterized protein n=1 Tax=Smallanthus sonchifolius TaxID=185202 RepID=A0ACB9BXS6_9ASTR|nr:hypothetical protein L1987_66596 [Smallanthus sonchifolius]
MGEWIPECVGKAVSPEEEDFGGKEKSGGIMEDEGSSTSDACLESRKLDSSRGKSQETAVAGGACPDVDLEGIKNFGNDDEESSVVPTKKINRNRYHLDRPHRKKAWAPVIDRPKKRPRKAMEEDPFNLNGLLGLIPVGHLEPGEVAMEQNPVVEPYPQGGFDLNERADSEKVGSIVGNPATPGNEEGEGVQKEKPEFRPDSPMAVEVEATIEIGNSIGARVGQNGSAINLVLESIQEEGMNVVKL